MSVDDRLREAFQADEPTGRPVGDSLRDVRAAERHQKTVRRQTLGAGTIAAATVAVMLFLLLGRGEPRAAVPIDQPTPAPTAVATPDSVDELHEWWRSPKITAAEVRGTLEDAGLGRWADAVIADLPEGPWTLTLSVQDRYWTLTANKGETDVVLDRETVTADGRRLVLSPQFADGTSTYDYSIRTDASGRRVLTLVFVETTEGPSNGGIPGEAFQRATYTAAVFKEFNK